jgi:two-component system sensor histidine kinase CreC
MGGKKSTGLGLSFVEQVIQLHQGQLQILNHSDGVEVRLYFPYS